MKSGWTANRNLSLSNQGDRCHIPLGLSALPLCLSDEVQWLYRSHWKSRYVIRLISFGDRGSQCFLISNSLGGTYHLEIILMLPILERSLNPLPHVQLVSLRCLNVGFSILRCNRHLRIAFHIALIFPQNQAKIRNLRCTVIKVAHYLKAELRYCETWSQMFCTRLRYSWCGKIPVFYLKLHL